MVEYTDGESARSESTSQYCGSGAKNTLLALDSIHIVPGTSGLLTTISKRSTVTPVILVSRARSVTGIVRSRGGVRLGVTISAGIYLPARVLRHGKQAQMMAKLTSMMLAFS